MQLSIILNHLAVSLFPWIVGLLAGGAVGLTFAHMVRVITASGHPPPAWLVLVPWRTLLLALYPATWGYLLVRFFGIGDATLMAHVGLTIFFLAVPFTAGTLFEYWYPALLATRLMEAARTLAALSLVLGTQGPTAFASGETGVGDELYSALAYFHFQDALYWWLAVVALILFVDLAFGVLEFAAARFRLVGASSKVS